MPVDSSLLVARFSQIWGVFNSTTSSLQIRRVLKILILSIDEYKYKRTVLSIAECRKKDKNIYM